MKTYHKIVIILVLLFLVIFSKKIESNAISKVDINNNNAYNISDLNGVYEKIKKAMINGDNVVAFKTKNATKITFKAFCDSVDKVINENPDIMYFNEWHYYSSTIGNNATYKVEFIFNFTKNQILTMEKKVNQKIHNIINTEITPNMSSYEKELKLHDYLVNNTVYDYKNLINNSVSKESHTAFGVLINRVGVCEGYSYAMKKLLNAAGIECRVIVGNASGFTIGSHAWNIVKLGNNYYQLDATFDDPIVNNGAINILSHKYFNLTDKQISKDHSWNIAKYPKCGSTIYKYKGK